MKKRVEFNSNDIEYFFLFRCSLTFLVLSQIERAVFRIYVDVWDNSHARRHICFVDKTAMGPFQGNKQTEEIVN